MLDRVSAEVLALAGAQTALTVRGALAQNLAMREPAVDDDHDPRYLHTARTIRILLADAACTDPAVLTAAAWLDTVDAALEPTDRSSLGADAAALLAGVPRPQEGDLLLEALLCAEPAAVLLAAAERLDQARHLHLRPDLDWPAFHAEVEMVYAPMAVRAAPLIGHRLGRWADAFRRRLLAR